MPRIPPQLVVAAAGGLLVLLAGCTADDPKPLPTAVSSTTTAALVDSPSSTSVTTDPPAWSSSSRVVTCSARPTAGQTTCTLDAAAYQALTAAAAKITAKDQAMPQPGAGDTTSTPTLGTDVGAVSVLDPRVVVGRRHRQPADRRRGRQAGRPHRVHLRAGRRTMAGMPRTHHPSSVSPAWLASSACRRCSARAGRTTRRSRRRRRRRSPVRRAFR